MKKKTPPQPKTALSCERLLLVDEDGIARIGNGGTVGLNRLMICDDNGKLGIDLRLTEKGKPVLSLFDKGALRAMLGVVCEEAGLFLCDATGQLRASLRVSPEGLPRLSFYDAGGRERIMLGLADNGGGFMGMTDDRERPRLTLMNTEESPSLCLRNTTGRVIWEAAPQRAPQLPSSKPKKPPRAPRRPAASTH